MQCDGVTVRSLLTHTLPIAARAYPLPDATLSKEFFTALRR
jgi:hypothetical protein